MRKWRKTFLNPKSDIFMSEKQTELLVGLILKYEKTKNGACGDQEEDIPSKISEILQTLEIKEEDYQEILFIIESLLEISTKPEHPLTFSQIIQIIYSNEYLHPCYYQLSSDLFPAEPYDEETYKIMKTFEENKEEEDSQK